MEIIKVDPSNPRQDAIEKAVFSLKQGGVIAYPTDTCYGLGADMVNYFGLQRLYRLKGRNYNKPISVIVKSIDKIKQMTEVDDSRENFLKKYLPGPITVVLLNLDYQSFEHISIGLRMPKYKITQLLAENFNRPFATTSANVSELNPCYSAEEIVYQFQSRKYQPDLILDAGRLEKNPPSTVVDLIKWPPRVLRQGGLKIEEAK